MIKFAFKDETRFSTVHKEDIIIVVKEGKHLV